MSVAIYPAAILAGWAVVSLCGAGSPRVEASRALQAVERLAPALTANAAAIATPQLSAMQTANAGHHVIARAEIATAEEIIAKAFPPAPPKDASRAPVEGNDEVAAAAAPAAPAAPEPQPIVVASLGDPAEVLPPEVTGEQTAAAAAAPSPPEAPVDTDRPRVEVVGECIVVEPCIDQFLFALYERTPKEDTIKETQRRQVTIKRKGKLVTVTRSVTRRVENDFTWKDPKAAERMNMSMMDYVIGGMDKSFKFKLFYMLQAAENAGLQPGITSAFRDNYRQSIAAGLKAAGRQLLPWRQQARRLRQGACGRYHQRQGRQPCAALGFDRGTLEMGRCQRQAVRHRPALSRPRSAACRTDRRPGIYGETWRRADCRREEAQPASRAATACGRPTPGRREFAKRAGGLSGSTRR